MSITDPYTEHQKCFRRLIKEFYKNESLIIGLDIDNTFFDCHSLGFEFPRLINAIKIAKSRGFTICAWTINDIATVNCRFKEVFGFEPDHYNDSPISFPGKESRKPFFNLLLDDRAGLECSLYLLEDILKFTEFTELGK